MCALCHGPRCALENGPLSDVTVTTGQSGDEPQIVLLDGDDAPVVILDYGKAKALANAIQDRLP